VKHNVWLPNGDGLQVGLCRCGWRSVYETEARNAAAEAAREHVAGTGHVVVEMDDWVMEGNPTAKGAP